MTHWKAETFCVCVIVYQAFHDVRGTCSSDEIEIYTEVEAIEILLMTWESKWPIPFSEAGKQQNVR